MSDMSFQDDMTDDELADPVERAQLELLAQIAQDMRQAVIGLQAVAEQMAAVAKAASAPREIVGTGADGKTRRAISSVKG